MICISWIKFIEYGWVSFLPFTCCILTPISSYQEDDVKKNTEKSIVQDTLCKNLCGVRGNVSPNFSSCATQFCYDYLVT